MARDLYDQLSERPTHFSLEQSQEADPSTIHTASVETIDNDRAAVLLRRHAL